MIEAFYREYIIDHYKNPRNFGRLKDPDYSQRVYNPLCGDAIFIQIKTKQKKGEERIAQVKFEGEGCAISQASASLLTEAIKNRDLTEVLEMKKKDVLQLLGIEPTPARLKCALLPLEAVKTALTVKDEND